MTTSPPPKATTSTAHSSSTTSVGTTSSTTVAAHPKPPRPAHPRLDDGSLGDQATRLACDLLTRQQIGGQFGGPVGAPTPTYPYCQWLVGSDAFLALDVEPGVSFQAATQYVVPLQSVSGVGQQAMLGNNRYLYFSSGTTSYWLLWQQVGDFTGLNVAQLSALARDVLATPPPVGRIPPLPLRAPGPPIYFAGDSTAAGPEWAWVTEHITSPELRTLAEYQVGSGLVVPGYFDWVRHILGVVAARRPKLVIYMGSANDGQAIDIDDSIQQVGSPAWRRWYGAQVGAVMSEVRREGAKLLWIGEPAMQQPSLSADMAVIDEVDAEEAARHPGVVFFNPGTVLDGPGGSYTGTISIDGTPTEVRLDGIHLNTAGSLYLAGFIARYVRRLLPGS